jgi:hypothetical protein
MTICCVKRYAYEFLVGFINIGFIYYLYQQLYTCHIRITEYDNAKERLRFIMYTIKVLEILNILGFWIISLRCMAKQLRCRCQIGARCQ